MSQKRRTPSDEPFLIVRTSASDMRGGSGIATHRHSWHQLAYVTSGMMELRTAQGLWLAPPSWAIWVPAGTDHALRFVGGSALRTAYLRPGWGGLDRPCGALAVSGLLRELLLRSVRIGMLDERDATQRALAELMVAEIRVAGPPPFALPEPVSPAMLRASEALAARDAPDAAALARLLGMGARSFERRFQRETGMSPGRWRQQRRLLDGLEAIAGGAPVKRAAAAAGYAAPSAFIAAFRKAFGVTPGQYFAG